jgi:Predicted membrane protein
MKQSPSTRLHVVDTLRGFAIVSIMLLHNLEHFDYYYFPSNLPHWMKMLDKSVWDSMFFLFSGKSYAIFALLFGLTFFIQSDNQAKKGKDFRLRFAWRLVLLLGFGLINSAFYEGDILTIYAILGFSLIPVAKLNTKIVCCIAIILMLQPWEWCNFIYGLQHPDLKLADPASWTYFGRSGEYITGNSFLKTMYGNFTNGKTAVYLWTWEEGRVFQTASLFMFGMLAGRKKLFNTNDENKSFWIRTLFIASICFIPLYIIKTNIYSWIPSMAIHLPLGKIISSWSNVAFMLVLVSGFVLLYQTKFAYRILNVFNAIGKMSMSNYIMQSIIGATVYCGFGFGLYKYTGATYCLLIGIGLAIVQGVFSSWWMKNYKQGPLEIIWHKLTWLNTE